MGFQQEDEQKEGALEGRLNSRHAFSGPASHCVYFIALRFLALLYSGRYCPPMSSLCCSQGSYSNHLAAYWRYLCCIGMLSVNSTSSLSMHHQAASSDMEKGRVI